MRKLDYGSLVAAVVARRGSGGVGMAAHDLGVTARHLREEAKRLGVDPDDPPLGVREAKAAFMTSYLERLMSATDGRVSTAAVVAGVTPQGLRDHLARYDVKADDYRPPEVKRDLEERRRRAKIKDEARAARMGD